MARFPKDLTLPEKKLLCEAAITYGFDPLMGEISIYQGRPFVSIDGRYRKAQETNQMDGVESRPTTKQEREDWQIPEGDFFFRSDVYVKGATHPFTGWGRVFKGETVGGKGFTPVEKNPQRMAEKRAEAQALRKAFHIPLPSIEDIGVRDGKIVDISTGEVIEGESRVVDTQTSELPPAVVTPPVEPSKPPVAPTAAPGKVSTDPTPFDKLIIRIKEHRPSMKTQKNVMDWLGAGPDGMTEAEVKADPNKVWLRIRDLLGAQGQEL
jgi:hypothetical protein